MAQNTNYVDLRSFGESPDPTPAFSLVRVGTDDVALLIFTASAISIETHYCDELDVRGYSRCGGPVCLLCQAGKRVEKKLLLPVVHIPERKVGAVLISASTRPGSLLAGLLPTFEALETGDKSVVFVRREDRIFHVASRKLLDAEFNGVSLIAAYIEGVEAGIIDPLTALPLRTKEEILAVPSIRAMIELRGHQ